MSQSRVFPNFMGVKVHVLFQIKYIMHITHYITISIK